MIIKKTFIGNLIISYLHCVECILIPKLISDEDAIKMEYKRATGHELNLNNPLSFTEKLHWYKLRIKLPLMAKCADKIDVRDYVASKGYGEALNEVYRVYNSVKELDFSELPQRFVLKASHGSHMNIIVKNKEKINSFKTKLLLDSWLHQYWGWGGREWVYKNLPRRIIAEKYLEDATGELRDYKFFCFNGSPRFVQVDIGRYGKKHVRHFYDMNWKLLPFWDNVGRDENLSIERPQSFSKMIKMATDLSSPFQFVRVDLYDIDSKPMFGELTFFHNSGVTHIKPYEWDLKIGDYWIIKE